eukprot:4082974-Prymnesium_polylepis.1
MAAASPRMHELVKESMTATVRQKKDPALRLSRFFCRRRRQHREPPSSHGAKSMAEILSARWAVGDEVAELMGAAASRIAGYEVIVEAKRV